MSSCFRKFSFSIVLFFSFFFSSSLYAQVNLGNGLIAYYPFNGNANDASGNNINGTVSGAVLTTDRNGNPGNAYQFDGTASSIQLPFSSLYDFAPTGAFSISLWVQPAAGSQPTATAGLVVKAPFAANFTQSAWNYGTYMLSNKFMTGYSNTNFLVSNTTMSNSQCWYNLVFTYNNAQWYMYMNGVLENSDLSGTYRILQDHSSGIVFGKKGMANGDYYKGKMDEVRIYNRELNAAEANALYYDGSSTCPSVSAGTCNNWLNTIGGTSAMRAGDLDVSGSTITVEALINMTSTTAYADIVSKHNTTTDVNYLLRPTHAEITTTNGFWQTPPACDIILNKTYHVAMTYDGNRLKFYRNGYLMSSVPCTGNMANNNWLTTIGNLASTPGSTGEPFAGYINEVRIWNVARTQAQIQTYMNASIPNPASQTGLLAYYTYDNLLNKQGNATWNGTVSGGAAINTTNPVCNAFVADSCATTTPVVVTAGFNVPDTVCVNSPVAIANTSTGASTYYWNFCTANINSTPVGTFMGNIGNSLSIPVFMDYGYENGNYYGFMVNGTPGGLIRLDFGNSLTNTPTATNLGNMGVIINSAQGIQVVNSNGRWYAIITEGDSHNGYPSQIVKVDFGTSLTNPAPVGTSWGNIGNLDYPTDLFIFKEGVNWYGLTVNYYGNSVTRFNFGTDFINPPTGVNIGNVGSLNLPSGICPINDNGTWRVFIANFGNNTLSRIDFGNSLLNTPTSSVNLGNVGGLLNTPRDLYLFKYCDQTVGFLVNDNTGDIVRLNFNNLTATPSAVSLGALGGATNPHSISKIFRIGADLYTFLPNSYTNTMSRIKFSGCTNASVPNSSLQNPSSITYNTPGTYNINLTLDDGLPTQTSLCKSVVVVNKPSVDFNFQQDGCNPLTVRFQGDTANASSLAWSFGNGTDATNSKDTITYGSYGNYTIKLTASASTGCADSVTKTISVNVIRDSAIITRDTTLCKGDTLVLNAVPGLNYCWSSSVGTVTNNTIQSPAVFPDTTTTYYVNSLQQGTNLIKNGDFSQGNNNFSSGYRYAFPNSPGNAGAGECYVGTNPVTWNPGAYPCTDHTTGNGNFLMINGSSIPTSAWGEPIVVIPNTNYTFSAWVESIYPADPARLQFSINGKVLGSIFTADTTACHWQQFYATWNSGNGTIAVIEIIDQNTDAGGNDFALDDIFFGSAIIKQDSVKITIAPRPVLVVSADTSICAGDTIHLSASGAGNYSWTALNNNMPDTTAANPVASPSVTTTYTVKGFDGTCQVQKSVVVTVLSSVNADFNFQQDACNPLTIQFQSQAPGTALLTWDFGNGSPVNHTPAPLVAYNAYGTYPVKLIAAAATGCKDSIVKQVNVTVVHDSTIINNDTLICKGNPVTLKAVPGLSYCWTSSVVPVTSNTIQSPTVTPDTTTTYYLNSLQQGTNLIVNGDFSQGNTGFTSTYAYAARNTIEGQYYVGPNPVAWNAGAFPCTDHTTGSGNMMMVNGSATANANVWSQTINNIQPNTNYAFSAWIESLDPINPAQLQFSINGQPVGNIFTASATSCLWQQFYTTWNSGNNATAVISLINKNTVLLGNDFDLDDLFFGSATIKQDSVKVTVIPPPVLLVSADTSICTGDTIHLHVSGSGNYSWTAVPNGAIQNPTTDNPSVAPSAATTYTVKESNDVCQVSKSIAVILYSKPDVTLLFKDSAICVNGSIALSASSTATVQYQWTPATGLSATSVNNPTASPVTSQTYTVKVTDVHTCTNKDSVQINVFQLPTVTVRPDTSSCKGDSVRLYITTTDATRFQWTPATGLSDATVAIPMAAPASSTAYTVTAGNPGGCSVTGSVALNVMSLPVATMSGDTTICLGGAAQLSAGGGNGYEWAPSSGLSGSQIASPIASPGTTTVYAAKVTDSNGCNATGSVQVSVIPQPVFAVQPPAVNTCYGDSVMITASGGDTFEWLNKNGVANPFAAQSKVDPSTTTTYQIKIVNNACRVTDTVYTTITVKPLPDVVIAKSNDIDCFTGTASLSASGGKEYHWYPSTGLATPDMSTTLVQVTQTTKYYVDVTSSDGCVKTDSVEVMVNTNTPGNQYLVPNAFTPNNDGRNDCFGIKGWGYILSLDFSVYNRMGQRVFHTTDPSQCWNGMFNGIPQQTGVFVYYIKATTICGALERKGTVTLVK